MMKYKYTRLRPDREELRLLKLLPGQFSDDIVVEIFHKRFDANPDYEALSYVWGSPNPKQTLFAKERSLDGATRLHHSSIKDGRESSTATVKSLAMLHITPNLGVALRHLRHRDHTRVLWIDAICINQEDLVERSSEVGKMGSIYGRARQVIVWLGPESENSSLAISLLRTIGHDTDIAEGDGAISVASGSQAEILRYNTDAMRLKVLSWIAIRDLLNREWFTRLWVFQEIGLASKAIMTTGNDELPWKTFKNAISWIENQVAALTPISEFFEVRDIKKAQSLMHQVFDGNHPTMPLYRLLELTKHSLCSNPRDRVYAILSLAHHSDLTGIVPDYSKATEAVYKDLVLKNMKKTRQLRLLTFCEIRHSPSDLRLPSWVPDLSIPRKPSQLWYGDASGNSQGEATYIKSDKGLQVRGIRTATIMTTTTPISHTARLPEILAICHVWEPPDLYTARYTGGGSLLDAFVRTLICGMVKGPLPPDSGDCLNMDDCRKAFIACVSKGEQQQNTAIYTFFLQIFLPGRAFFVTDEGYIGLGPASARPGDRVMVILGCPVPILLRPVPGRREYYQVVGECFVDGLMAGEGLLGPLPPDWTRKWAHVEESLVSVYTHATDYNSCPTQQDPRLGPLPSSWKVRYGSSGKANDQQDSELDDSGKMKLMWYEEVSTGYTGIFDPRLSSAALKERGVSIQDYILV
ncbi:HET-domain-containing protein [Acephala macrosclerotiorum]|nr:HET-domain-containing protein [Acephala macrosclerotiorum]